MTQLLSHIEQIYKSLNNEEEFDMIYLDFAKGRSCSDVTKAWSIRNWGSGFKVDQRNFANQKTDSRC